MEKETTNSAINTDEAAQTNQEIQVTSTTDKPTPHEEIYYHPKWVKITFLSLAILFLILAICSGKLPIEFDYFFGTMHYWQGCSLICFIFLMGFVCSFGEKRDGKIYLNKFGKLDIETPREYEALKAPGIVRFLGRSQPVKGEGLARFKYTEGVVTIVTNKGNSIKAPLSELKWKYSMTKPNVADDWSIYKYTVSDKDGNSIVFFLNNATFASNEWDDINMLLSLCGTVEESKTSKISKKLSKVLESVKDFDFSDIAGSSVSLATDQVYEGSTKVIDMVKAKLISKKKKNGVWAKLGKIKDWIFWIILAIYVLAVIAFNIVTLIEYFSDSKENNIEQVADSDATSNENTYHLTGIIDGKYDIDMTLDFNTGTGTYYYTKYGPDNTLQLIITDLTGDGTITIEEYNSENTQTGLFEGRISTDHISGWYTNYQGKNMPFHLDLSQDGVGEDLGLLNYVISNSTKSLYGYTPAYYYEGYFTAGKSEYPVEFVFINDDGNWSVVYKNLHTSNTKLNMEIIELGEDNITLKNTANDFIVSLHRDIEGELSGTAIQGSSSLRVRLLPKTM